MKTPFIRLPIFLGLLLAAFAAGVAGCASHRAPPPQTEPADVMGPVIPDTTVDRQELPPSQYGPPVPAPGDPVPNPATTGGTITTEVPLAAAMPIAVGTSTATSTATQAAAPAKLCVVLGPGMAKAMAEAAVLEALRKAKLPIDCVVGTEMGAIVGALYASTNGNTNSLEWQLFKINKDNYFAFPMLSLREPRSTGRKLNEFLRGIFHDGTIEHLPVPFGTSAVDDDGDTQITFTQGDLVDALSASVAIPGVFDSWKIGDRSFRSAATADPAPLELARRLGGNFLVLVDVLIDGGTPSKSRYHRAFTASRSVLKLQKREAQFVIPVNTGAIAFDDFGRRAEVLGAGSEAVEKALPDLRAAWEKWSAGQR